MGYLLHAFGNKEHPVANFHTCCAVHDLLACLPHISSPNILWCDDYGLGLTFSASCTFKFVLWSRN